MSLSSAQNWNKFSANHHADLKTVALFPFCVIMETNISSFSFLLELVFQQCAQQVTTLYDFKHRFSIKMQPNHNSNIQVCRFSIIMFLNLILLHYFVIMKHRSKHFTMLGIGHESQVRNRDHQYHCHVMNITI